MIAAAVAALANAAYIVHLKWFLRASKAESRNVLPLHFLWLFLITLFLVPTFGSIDAAFFAPKNLILFGIMLAVAVVWNYVFLRSFRRESLHEYELNDVLFPVFGVGLAALTFVDERQPIQLSLATLAVGAFFLTHLRHRHLTIKQADRWMVYAVFLMAMELILYKPLLTLLSPVTLYALRTGFLALIFFVALRPDLRRLHWPDAFQLLFSAGLGVATKVLELVAIGQIGLVVTQLFFLITPITLAVVSTTIFHERWTFRQSLAFGVILVCIAAVTLLPN